MNERRVSLAESVLSHLAIVAGVAFSLYPVLWVVSTALSAGSAPERRVLPIPRNLSLDHVSQFLSGPHVVSQAVSSLVVSVATALATMGNIWVASSRRTPASLPTNVKRESA